MYLGQDVLLAWQWDGHLQLLADDLIAAIKAEF